MRPEDREQQVRRRTTLRRLGVVVGLGYGVATFVGATTLILGSGWLERQGVAGPWDWVGWLLSVSVVPLVVGAFILGSTMGSGMLSRQKGWWRPLTNGVVVFRLFGVFASIALIFTLADYTWRHGYVGSIWGWIAVITGASTALDLGRTLWARDRRLPVLRRTAMFAAFLGLFIGVPQSMNGISGLHPLVLPVILLLVLVGMLFGIVTILPLYRHVQLLRPLFVADYALALKRMRDFKGVSKQIVLLEVLTLAFSGDLDGADMRFAEVFPGPDLKPMEADTLAWLLACQGRYSEAENRFEESMAGLDSASGYRGKALCQVLDDRADALTLELVDLAIDRTTTPAVYRWVGIDTLAIPVATRALVLAVIGRDEEARSEAEDSAGRINDVLVRHAASVHWRLAETYRRLGDSERVRAHAEAGAADPGYAGDRCRALMTPG